MSRNLKIFISSTGDIESLRDSAEDALKHLDINESRFESWPSSPNNSIDECLIRIDESDALILLLGKNYGSLHESGISITHLEYRHAIKKKLPIFAYIIKCDGRDPEQDEFIREVEEQYFRKITTKDELYNCIRLSLLDEFKKCFKQIHSPPEEIPKTIINTSKKHIQDIKISEDAKSTYNLLSKLLSNSNDELIYNLKTDIFEKHKKNLNIINSYYLSVINLGMSNTIVNRREILNAIDFLKTNLNKFPGYEHSFYYNIGNAYSALNENSHAIDHYKKALTYKNDFPECWKNLGSAYHEKNDIKNAEKCYFEAINYNPLLFEALYSIATLLINRKRKNKDALKYLDRIQLHKLSPEIISSVFYWKIMIYQIMGDISNAIAFAEEDISQNPESKWSWDLLAHLYSQARHLDNNWLIHAYEFFKKYIIKNPENPEAYAELGFICLFLRESIDHDKLSNESLEYFIKATDLNFIDDGLVWDKIGHLYQENDDWIQAEKAFKKATLINNKDFGYCLGVALSHLEKYKEALPYLIDAAEKYHPDELSWHNLAACYEQLGLFNKSENAYLKSIKINKNYALSWFNIGGLYWNNGLYDKAKYFWDKAINKFPEDELVKNAKEFLELK